LTDVNIAVDMLRACIKQECDSIYLVSADNDMVPSLRAVRELFPSVDICVVFPIMPKAKHLISVCQTNGFRYMRMREKHLVGARLPDPVMINGKKVYCPSNWQ
jgi:F420-dependent methylenetetrahydromethanopterin dehydrogenase